MFHEPLADKNVLVFCEPTKMIAKTLDIFRYLANVAVVIRCLSSSFNHRRRRRRRELDQRRPICTYPINDVVCHPVRRWHGLSPSTPGPSPYSTGATVKPSRYVRARRASEFICVNRYRSVIQSLHWSRDGSIKLNSKCNRTRQPTTYVTPPPL